MMPETSRRNSSRKRSAVYEALCATKEHPTAEMLYNAIKPRYPEISLGTVYRSLSTFKEEGTAISVGNVDGNERYDACTRPHPHFICRKCRRVIDIDMNSGLPELCSGIESGGCTVETWNISFIGVCGDCGSAGKN